MGTGNGPWSSPPQARGGATSGVSMPARPRASRTLQWRSAAVGPKTRPCASLASPSSRSRWGAPCIRGLRVRGAMVVSMVADGMTDALILDAFPDLEREDVREALRYAAEAVRERELPLVKTAWVSRGRRSA